MLIDEVCSIENAPARGSIADSVASLHHGTWSRAGTERSVKELPFRPTHASPRPVAASVHGHPKAANADLATFGVTTAPLVAERRPRRQATR